MLQIPLGILNAVSQVDACLLLKYDNQVKKSLYSNIYLYSQWNTVHVKYLLII